MSRIILITGGQRSGKSEEAERMALALSDCPVYMATAQAWDDDMRRRIQLHQERRGPQWTNIEEPLFLSRHDVNGRVVLIDCCTLWATNFMFNAEVRENAECGNVSSAEPMQNAEFNKNAETLVRRSQCRVQNAELLPFGKGNTAQPNSAFCIQNSALNKDSALNKIKAEFDRFTSQDATFIFVTNEIGMGGTSDNALQRRFTDLQGWLNQYIAARADEVILMISGIAMKIK